MSTSHIHSGTLRTGYETDRARLDDFPAVESGWRELLHRLVQASGDIRCCDGGREGTLARLWADHVLTVLVEIGRTDVSGERFPELHGTAGQAAMAAALCEKAGEWVSRLGNYLARSWRAGRGDTPAAAVAVRIKTQLADALSGADQAGKRPYYRLIRTLRDIRGRTGPYLEQVENSGEMDGAFSLLLVFLRGYGGIAAAFNRRFAALPELYRRDILRVAPRGAVQDNAYVVVTPAEGAAAFTLPAHTPFAAGQNAAGEELVYQTRQKEYIRPAQCAGVYAVYLGRKAGKTTGIHRQVVRFRDASTSETLFSGAHSRSLELGWWVESPMFVLGEGERNVCVYFRLTAETARMLPPELSPDVGFALQLSGATGWTEQPHHCRIDTADGAHRLRFDFTIAWDGVAPASCNPEIHGATTRYPALRIVTSRSSCPYDWASRLTFDAVGIRTEVTGIRRFTFYNELGEVDTSQPFYPFGMQAEKGACFFFGNEEMGLKPVREVRLKGCWKRMPETEAEFDGLYRGYTAGGQPVRTGSFAVAAEWQQGGQWHPCADGTQHLFLPDRGEERSLTRADIRFDCTTDNRSNHCEYLPRLDGFFRATLQSPAIGFGTEVYRTLFTETMLHNSRCKKRKCKAPPAEPALPLLADVELSYTASTETTWADRARSAIRLGRLTALPEQEPPSVDRAVDQPFLPAFPADHLLYLAFLRATGAQTVRIYLDLALPQEKIPFYAPPPDRCVQLAWEYRNEAGWQSLPAHFVLVEETAGLTQSGFVEIKLPQKPGDSCLDSRGRMWLRAAVTGDIASCLAVRTVRTNCIRLTALNGDGFPLPAGTIQGLQAADERIESVVQPLPGFGGKPAETETEAVARETVRISTRGRAVALKDYERLVLEHFPEADKVQCLLTPREPGAPEVRLVVFSRAEDSRYFLSPAWKLAEIQRWLRSCASPAVSLRVMNPVYERVDVRCRAVLWERVQNEGKALRQLVVLAQNYIAPWYRNGEIPALRKRFSHKELHARMANHEDLMKVVDLYVDGKRLPHTGIDTGEGVFHGKYPWSVLLPNIEIELLSPRAGVNYAEIGGNFIIR